MLSHAELVIVVHVERDSQMPVIQSRLSQQGIFWEVARAYR